MKILTIASSDISNYLEDISLHFNSNGVESEFIAKNKLTQNNCFNFLLSRKHKRIIALKNLIAKKNPDLLFMNSSRHTFDFRVIREFYKKRIVWFDMEGPNFDGFNDSSWIDCVDMVITVSKYSARLLSQKHNNVIYMPHCCNPERFYQVEAPQEFQTPIAFVGQSKPHRNEYLNEIAQFGLKLYGASWYKVENTLTDVLRQSRWENCNIRDEKLLQAISGAELFVNILQDQFKDLKTLMNLQAFMVAACQSTLITEYVEELPETFEIGKEVIAFNNKEELFEQVQKLSKDKVLARKIAQNGYKRFMACHTMKKRTQEMLKLFKPL